MGGEQAANVLVTVQSQQKQRDGKQVNGQRSWNTCYDVVTSFVLVIISVMVPLSMGLYGLRYGSATVPVWETGS